MTHKKIAHDFACQIYALAEKEANNGMLPAKSDLAALILSAAAKMVQQSGAVEALERNTGGLAFMAGAFGHQLRQEDKLANTAAFADARAALHSLRSITGEAGK